MTQDERWQEKYQTYLSYLRTNKRRPSKYRPEDRDLVNWLKHNRKLRNKGLLPDKRKGDLEALLAEAFKYQRVNQHAYLHKSVKVEDE